MTKNRLTIVLALLLSVLVVGATTAAPVKVKGRVIEQGNGIPIGYATVVALAADSTIITAAVADGEGTYNLDIDEGTYIFNINCIGYQPHGQELSCSGHAIEVDFELAPSSVAMEEVKVRAARVRRESDRYVVSVAGTMEAIGKTAEEFLSTAPAVWIRNDKIMVEGRSGVQVMVNDRILNMDDEQVLAYLRNLNADDIARIEIIPRAGADQDASAQGGIIKITLKKKRDDGIEITPSMRAQWGKDYYRYRPNLSVNYRIGSLSMYTQVYTDNDKQNIGITELNNSNGTILDSKSENRMKEHAGGGRFGAIYDINDNQSVGVEYATYLSNEIRHSNPYTTIYSPDPVSSDSSYYRDNRRYRNHYAAANYILRLDSLGSVFKVIGDVSRTRNGADNRYFNQTTYLAGTMNGMTADTLYSSDTKDKYLVATGTASLEKVFADQSRLQAGMKFIYTSLDDDSRYYGDLSGQWQMDLNYSLLQKYTEKIGAAYISYKSNLGKLSYNLGVRGEYTHANPETSLFDGSAPEKNKNTYFSLFPTANLSIPFNAEKGYSVAAFYARKISRPGYWALNPIRMQLSEYSYIIGDPSLKPSYIDETGLTFIFAHKYTLTGSYRARKNTVQQYVTTDDLMPEVIVYRYTNIGSYNSYNISANLPVDITEKINLNANLYYTHTQMDPGDAGRRHLNNSVSANASLNVTLPRSYRLEFTGYYMSSELWGNMRSKAVGDMNVAVRKRFFNDKVSASVQVNNVFEFSKKQKLSIEEDNFTRNISQTQAWNSRMFVMSIQYNFKAGRKANGRSVERGGDDSR